MSVACNFIRQQIVVIDEKLVSCFSCFELIVDGDSDCSTEVKETTMIIWLPNRLCINHNCNFDRLNSNLQSFLILLSIIYNLLYVYKRYSYEDNIDKKLLCGTMYKIRCVLHLLCGRLFD